MIKSSVIADAENIGSEDNAVGVKVVGLEKESWI
jgi:hypothetical protein